MRAAIPSGPKPLQGRSQGIRVSKAGGAGAGVSGFASIGLPIVNEVDGLQAKPSSRFVGGSAIAY